MMTTLSSLRAERMVVPCQGAALCAWGLVMPRDMGDRRRGRKGRAQASSGRPGQESAASLVDFDCRRVGEEYRFAERDGFARDAAAGGQGHKGEFALCLSEQRAIDRRGEDRKSTRLNSSQ